MDGLFQGLFKGKRILITGDTGFKGSWLSIWLLELGADVYGYALPPKTATDNYVTSGIAKRIIHRDGDIRNLDAFLSFVKEVRPEIAFHLAAQPLVLHSYENPQETFSTNLMGTVNFFEAVRMTDSIKVAVNVTSDKCYENKDWVWGYRENDPIGGKDPYSASKGCSELITGAYAHSYFLVKENTQIASARAGNVIGGGDWAADRIVPDFFKSYLNKTDLIIRNPDHTRPWQHVLEPLSGYLLLAMNLFLKGKTYQGSWNFGPMDSSHYSVKTLVQCLANDFGKGSFRIDQSANKVHESSLLKLDVSKAAKYLEWRPVLNFKETVAFTVEGYKAELTNKDVYASRVNQMMDYAQLASQQEIPWAS